MNALYLSFWGIQRCRLNDSQARKVYGSVMSVVLLSLTELSQLPAIGTLTLDLYVRFIGLLQLSGFRVEYPLRRLQFLLSEQTGCSKGDLIRALFCLWLNAGTRQSVIGFLSPRTREDLSCFEEMTNVKLCNFPFATETVVRSTVAGVHDF